MKVVGSCTKFILFGDLNMGAESSTLEDINENSLLTKLTGDLKVERDDIFWDQLLDFAFEYPQDRFVFFKL